LMNMYEYVPRESTSFEDLTRIGISYALALKEKIERARIPGEFRLIISANSTSIHRCRTHALSGFTSCDETILGLKKT